MSLPGQEFGVTDRWLAAELTDRGFVHLDGPAFRHWAGIAGESEFESFARSWQDLGPDLYMADGGRYRRRRHAAFALSGGSIERLPHRPHFQSRDYNPLNGDVQRWFEPVAEEVATSRTVRNIAARLTPLFSRLDGCRADQSWLGEVHQFRIEAGQDAPGLPTPEGLHRDGVDWVLVMLLNRQNVMAGTTQVVDYRGETGHFTLCEPGEAILLDDRRIAHAVTPITPLDPRLPACRDVLVMTWLKQMANAN